MRPTRREAFRFWLKLGFISFGGPVGQIAIMHREAVELRRWVDERTFMQALNFCVLVPGPEALQLAIWLGWRLHGTRGGIVAGLLFLGPSVLFLLALSYVYAQHGDLPLVAAALYGLQATVIALIVQALVRIARMIPKGQQQIVPPAVSAFLSEGSPGVKVRVRRLVELAATDPSLLVSNASIVRFTPWFVLALMVVVGITIESRPQVLAGVHHLVEQVVVVLS